MLKRNDEVVKEGVYGGHLDQGVDGLARLHARLALAEGLVCGSVLGRILFYLIDLFN